MRGAAGLESEQRACTYARPAAPGARASASPPGPLGTYHEDIPLMAHPLENHNDAPVNFGIWIIGNFGLGACGPRVRLSHGSLGPYAGWALLVGGPRSTAHCAYCRVVHMHASYINQRCTSGRNYGQWGLGSRCRAYAHVWYLQCAKQDSVSTGTLMLLTPRCAGTYAVSLPGVPVWCARTTVLASLACVPAHCTPAA